MDLFSQNYLYLLQGIRRRLFLLPFLGDCKLDLTFLFGVTALVPSM